MRKVLPPRSVKCAPALPWLKYQRPSGPNVTECSAWSWLRPSKPVSSTSRLSTAGSKTPIAIDVGVDDEIGRIGDDDLVADDGDAERRHERGFLDERCRLVGAAVAVGVFEHHDAIALRIALLVAAVVHALGHPDAALRVDVDVGGILEHGRLRPDRDLEPVGHREDVERHESRRRCGRGCAAAAIAAVDRRKTGEQHRLRRQRNVS